MDESERGRGNGGKEGRRTEEGTGELLVMAGERRNDDHDSKTKVGTSFVRLAKREGRVAYT